MAAVTPDINQTRAMRVAMKRIEGFAKQFGEAHRNLARHAAFPLVLTPDLLYQIWANFVPEAPWAAVAHVLLSRLCRQVGYEIYEMDITDRKLIYANGVTTFVRGNREDATARFAKLPVQEHQVEIAGVSLDIPLEEQSVLQIAETQNHQKFPAVVTEISDDAHAESDEKYPLGHLKKTPRARISHLREKRGITKAELARSWGVSNVTVQSWEKETSKAHHLVHLVLLCHLLSCTPRDLVSYLPPSTPGSNRTKNLDRIRQQVSQEEHSASDNSPAPVTRIAELRESKGLTQSQIATALDVSANTIQNWERGRTSWWQFVQFIKLCDILYCAPEELVENIPEERINAVEELLQNKSKAGIARAPAQQKQLTKDTESGDVLDWKNQP